MGVPRVLVACEYSRKVAQAFESVGCYALSCDILPAECGGNHYEGPVEDVLGEHWDCMVAHPPCTRLTNSGVRWLAERKLWPEMREGAAFFNKLRDAQIKRKALENPIPHKYARELIGPYSQIIQPWQFGHEEMKATCLWLFKLPKLLPTNIVGPPPKDKIERRKWAKVHLAPPGPDRWKDRSRTYDGIAEAMGSQWGPLLFQQGE